MDESKNPILLAKHLALIVACQARVILVWGTRAEDIVRHTLRVSRQGDLKLRGFKYALYVMDTGRLAKRLFVRCPEIPADRRSMTSTVAVRICEALRFAISMANVTAIRPDFEESSSILATSSSLLRTGGPDLRLDLRSVQWMARSSSGWPAKTSIKKKISRNSSSSWALYLPDC